MAVLGIPSSATPGGVVHNIWRPMDAPTHGAWRLPRIFYSPKGALARRQRDEACKNKAENERVIFDERMNDSTTSQRWSRPLRGVRRSR